MQKYDSETFFYARADVTKWLMDSSMRSSILLASFYSHHVMNGKLRSKLGNARWTSRGKRYVKPGQPRFLSDKQPDYTMSGRRSGHYTVTQKQQMCSSLRLSWQEDLVFARLPVWRTPCCQSLLRVWTEIGSYNSQEHWFLFIYFSINVYPLRQTGMTNVCCYEVKWRTGLTRIWKVTEGWF